MDQKAKLLLICYITLQNNIIIGIGALYVRRRPRVRVDPIQSGGGQERGLRSGTVPAPLVVGLGEACSIALNDMEYDHNWMVHLSNRLLNQINSKLTHVIRNGDPEQCYPGCINLSFAFVEGYNKNIMQVFIEI